MTEITRSVEIDASIDEVWSQIQPANWPRLFSTVKKVDGYTASPGVGTHASVLAGESGISYNIEITQFVERSRIAYKRYGGPLSGTGVIELRALQSGTVLKRTGFYDDSLAEETMKSICDGIEQDNQRIKKTVEDSKKH